MICKSFCGELPPPPPPPPPPPSAGEIEFGGTEAPAQFIFTQAGTDDSLVTFAGITLDPVSSDFESPSPGTLRYVGQETKRFLVNWSLTFSWVSASDGVTRMAFFAEAFKNDTPMRSTFSGSVLDIAVDTELAVFGHSSQTLLDLEPGDELTIRISAIFQATYSLAVLAYTLSAAEV